MTKGCKNAAWFLLVMSFLLSSACNTGNIVHPRHGLSIDQMEADVNQGIKDDQKFTKKPHLVPFSVSKALLPSVASSMPRPNIDVERRFDITANKIPARDFFMSLVEGSKYNIIISPGVIGTITLELKKVTIQETLEAIQDIYGYEFHRTSYGYEVTPAKLDTKIFTVNYLDVQRKGKSLTQMTSGQITESIGSSGGSSSGGSSGGSSSGAGSSVESSTAGGVIDTRTDSKFWQDLTRALQQIVGNTNGRGVVVNSQSGVVIVHAYPAELRHVTRYLERIQMNMNRQVILEAKVLEIQLNDQFQSGVDWNLIGKSALADGGLFQTGDTSFSNTTLSDFTSIFTLRVNGDFGGVIKLLQTQGQVQVLSSPRVSTVNNQKAIIKVGTDQFFVTGVTSTPTAVSGGGSGAAVAQEGITLTPFFSGVTLDVTPQISSNDEVILHIHPTVSVVQDQIKTIILGNNGPGSGNNTFVLPLAESTIRESDTIVRAKSGQMIVIGGLIQNDMREEVAGLPLLSKLPYIGPFFRRTSQLATKIELVILLRPLIAKNENWIKDLKHTRKTLNNMHRGFHEGTLPEVFGNEAERGDY